MTISQAYKLIHAVESDSDKLIKQKYHQAIKNVHPDSDMAQQELRMKQSQRINEAYALIVKTRKAKKKSAPVHQSASPSPTWTAAENPDALLARSIYQVGHLGSTLSGIDAQPVAHGRFYWVPSIESFAMFTFSIHKLCLEQMNDAYLDHGPSFGSMQETQDRLRLRLFHLLMQEYIRPWDCLTDLAADNADLSVSREEANLPAEITLKGSQNIRTFQQSIESDHSLHLTTKQDQIHIETTNGIDLGHITFMEDALYYIVLLLIQHDAAKSHVTIRKSTQNKSVLPHRLSLHLGLCFYDPDPILCNHPADHHLEIAQLLQMTEH